MLEYNGLLRIDFNNLSALSLRILSGNKAGAKEHWIPESKLPTGHDKAVIDAIPKGSFTEMDISTATQKTKDKRQKTKK